MSSKDKGLSTKNEQALEIAYDPDGLFPDVDETSASMLIDRRLGMKAQEAEKEAEEEAKKRHKEEREKLQAERDARVQPDRRIRRRWCGIFLRRRSMRWSMRSCVADRC